MSTMVKHAPAMPVSVFRGCRLALHLGYGMWLAAFYPLLSHTRQHRTLKKWSGQLLAILNISIQIDGLQLTRDKTGCLLVANHISWLDIFVLNAIHPAIFIAKSEVRRWPLVGWLCKRSGTLFIERAMRQDAASINQHIGNLLKQDACVVLFPEGTTTNGDQVGHFHSALIQPAIDAGARLHPIALSYRDEAGKLSTAAAFTGDMTLAQSIWRVLRCAHLNALAVFTPALIASGENRRVLARAAQQAIAQELLGSIPRLHASELSASFVPPQPALSAQSAYVLLLDPILNRLPK